MSIASPETRSCRPRFTSSKQSTSVIGTWSCRQRQPEAVVMKLKNMADVQKLQKRTSAKSQTFTPILRNVCFQSTGYLPIDFLVEYHTTVVTLIYCFPFFDSQYAEKITFSTKALHQLLFKCCSSSSTHSISLDSSSGTGSL